MPLAVILLCAADMPNNIKRYVRHTMVIGLTSWCSCESVMGLCRVIIGLVVYALIFYFHGSITGMPL